MALESVVLVEGMAGPLTGINVLEVSHVLSGPFCTMLLADLGANVVKIERPGLGDEARRLGPLIDGESSYFMSVNRGKKSVTIDLSREEGQTLARELSKKMDILVENFVPGTSMKLGLDYPQLSRLNPRLIYASISGFGQDGPYAKYPAFDIIVQAMGGLMSVTGEPNGRPLRPGASLGDSIAGLFTASALLVALWQRERTGQGRYIDISMLDCQITIMENALARFFATGEVPGPLGSRHPAAVPFQAFATLDGYIVVAIISDSSPTWTRFCKSIGHPEVANDPRFVDGRSRVDNYEILAPILDKALRTRPSREWLEKFSKLGIPCGPVNNVKDVVADPQIRHRGMIAQVPHHTLGGWNVANTPFKFDGERSMPRGSSPLLGEHTDAVLEEFLALSSSDLASLRSRGVI